jgi:hypothetical protein
VDRLVVVRVHHRAKGLAVNKGLVPARHVDACDGNGRWARETGPGRMRQLHLGAGAVATAGAQSAQGEYRTQRFARPRAVASAQLLAQLAQLARTLVSLCGLLDPLEELHLAGAVLLDLVAQDESPRQPEDQPLVAALQVVGADVDELDALGLDRLQEDDQVLALLEGVGGLAVVLFDRDCSSTTSRCRGRCNQTGRCVSVETMLVRQHTDAAELGAMYFNSCVGCLTSGESLDELDGDDAVLDLLAEVCHLSPSWL